MRRLTDEKRRRALWRFIRRAFFFLIVLGIIGGIVYEMRTSRLQARHLTRLAAKCTFRVEPEISASIHFPEAGPYDKRLGYVDLSAFIDRLASNGYGVTEQSRFSPFLINFAELGFYPPYQEKPRAGLNIADRTGRLIFSSGYPEHTYPEFGDIPDIVVNLLLYIENRELLDTRFPYKNPAIEWKRLAGAALELGLSLVDQNRNVPGGSTLATQIVKYRHSPNGQTSSVYDKLRQMVSASVKAYLYGEETLNARRRIVLDFINSMPLGAISGYGEISGLGDGLYTWYGVDFPAVMRTLSTRPAGPDGPDLYTWALSLKQVLSLFIAQRRPSDYLLKDHPALSEKTNSYLRLLTEAGVITSRERDAALPLMLDLRESAPEPEKASFLTRKAVNTVRTNLLTLLGLDTMYQLNHLDLSVESTIDQTVQKEVTALLKQMNDPLFAGTAGLTGYRLLENSDPSKVIYSLTLYERSEGANLIRIQTDTYDQPLNINSGIKLELGSSAKLRTLVTYLEIVAALHGRYCLFSPEELRVVETAPADHISRWALDYLARTEKRDLAPMLAAALQRKYSASPHEQFYTGGGVHSFANFDSEHDTGTYTVRSALYHSINLVFIRLMRDIVQYYKFQIPGISDLLSDVKNPLRHEYLAKFADQEGTLFLRRFYRKYAGVSFDNALLLLLQHAGTKPERLAAVIRYVSPETDREAFKAFLSARINTVNLSDQAIVQLYEKYAPEAYSLVDRGYISRIHPLELWMFSFLHQHPEADLSTALSESSEERQAVYSWLFNTSRKNKQDIRIRTLLEVEAFNEIHAAWKRLKYPFASLVPSYATAIGSSADRPAALAELVGIILNHGQWYPSIRVRKLKFGEDTPYETSMAYKENPGEQIIHPEVAAVVRESLLGVVSEGTAKRLHQAFPLPDGTHLSVGGKTGTGDNRFEVYGAGGKLIQSNVINRTAVFVFFIGDRYFGVLTAYVAGPEAANYRFTSSLPTQILKILAPALMPLMTNYLN